MKPSEYLKERFKYLYAEYCESEKRQNELLEELVGIRKDLNKYQQEINQLQIAIEKLEKTE